MAVYVGRVLKYNGHRKNVIVHHGRARKITEKKNILSSVFFREYLW